MIKYNKDKNLLIESNWRPFLQDVEQPNLFRDLFDYDTVPKVAFNFRQTPIDMDNRHDFPRRSAVHFAVHGRSDSQYL